MIYVCSLYSNGLESCPLPSILLEKRVSYVESVVHKMLLQGKYPYSPILHCHGLSKRYKLPKEYSFWQSIDRNMIDHCSKVLVLCMKDRWGCWEKSTGIQDEIAYAESIGKEITYYYCEDYK